MSDQNEVTRGEVPPRIAAIMAMGVTVHNDSVYEGEPGVDRHRVRLLDTVTRVEFPFDAEDWLSVAMREPPNGVISSYMGGCCGNMSQMQDYVNGVFRDGGFADGAEFLLIGHRAREHDGFETFRKMTDDEFNEAIEQWAATSEEIEREHPVYVGTSQPVRMDPWFKLGIVFNAVEDYLSPKFYTGDEVPKPESDPVRILERGLQYLSWNDLFANGNGPENGPENGLKRSLDDQHEANRRLVQARSLEAARKLVSALEAEGIDFEGFAIVGPDDGEVLTNGKGQCIFTTREDAQEVIELWKRMEADDARRRAEFKDPETYDYKAPAAEIVPCRVTVAKGLEVLR